MNLLHTSDNHAVLSIDPASEKSLTDKCKDLLNFWKGNSNDPKWEEVIEALRNMDGLRNFATMLENALKGTGTSTNSHGKYYTSYNCISFVNYTSLGVTGAEAPSGQGYQDIAR